MYSFLFAWRGARAVHLLGGSIPTDAQRDGHVVGSCDVSFLGFRPLLDVPSTPQCSGTSWSIRILCWPQCCRVDHDFLPDARFALLFDGLL